MKLLFKYMSERKRLPVLLSIAIAILVMVLSKDIIIAILAFLSEGGWRLTLTVIGTIIVALLISHAKGD